MRLRSFAQRSAQKLRRFYNTEHRCLTSAAYSSHRSRDIHSQSWLPVASAAACLTGATLLGLCKSAQAESREPEPPSGAGYRVAGLPEYTRKDISEHGASADRIWITFRDGVYDITEFCRQHPGGEQKILMAGGGAIDPFWAIYSVHKTPRTFAILEKLRIGNLKHEAGDLPSGDLDDPFRNDPTRLPALKVLKDKPFNAETPIELIPDNFLTPNELYYIRHHLPVPVVDPATYKLTIEDSTGATLASLSLSDLKSKFDAHEVVTTMVCGGNRRGALNDLAAVRGFKWGAGVLSTAKWKGVWLRDILGSSGIRNESDDIKHVWFTGLDTDFSQNYGGSIDIDRALDPRADVLIAYEMNGVEIPRDHGYPVRAIVPGVLGARSVKWLGHIRVSPDMSPALWQQGPAYRMYPAEVTWENIDQAEKPAPIEEWPVMSAICSHAPGAEIYAVDETVRVRGYAYSGGGRGINRVDVSADGGKTFTPARLLPRPSQPRGRVWAWTLWEAELPISVADSETELVCRALDSSHNVQPERPETIWNLRGLLNNSWHRVPVSIVVEDDDD
eukprot:778079_1